MGSHTIFLVLLATLANVSGMELRFSNHFSRMGRISSGKDVTTSDQMRAKALGFVALLLPLQSFLSRGTQKDYIPFDYQTDIKSS